MDLRSTKHATWLVVVLGGLVALTGTVVLVARFAGNQLLAPNAPGWALMQINAALGLGAAGLGLALAGLGRRRASAAVGLAVGVLGAVTLSQYLFDVDLGIDTLLLAARLDQGWTSPPRMAPNTATALLVCGAGLVLAGLDRLRGGLSVIYGVTGVLLVVSSGVALLTYTLGFATASGWTDLTRMAVPTAICVLFLALGLLRLATHRVEPAPRRILWMPLAVGAATAVLALVFWQTVLGAERTTGRQRLQAEARALGGHIQVELQSRGKALRRLAEHVERADGEAATYWSADAARLLEDESFWAIGLLDSELRVRAAQPQGAEAWDGLWTAAELRAACEASLEDPQGTLPRSLVLPTGRRGLARCIAVQRTGEAPVFLAAATDLTELLEGVIPWLELAERTVRVRVGAELLLQHGSARARYAQRATLPLSDVPLHVEVGVDSLGSITHGLAEEILALGLLTSIALGAMLHYMGTARERRRELEGEISERARVQRGLNQRTRDLETLLYIASHDLKEPLRAIENFSRLVQERYADRLDDKGQDFLRRVRRAAQRLDRLLDDLLQLSRAARIAEPSTAVPLREVVDEAVALLRDRIEETGARLSVADDFATLPLDRTWARQAVYNLLANALKFTRDGEAPEIAIEPVGGPGSSVPSARGVAVRDRGPGVEDGQADRIFQMFQRAVGRHIEGTGAGLAIVRQVAERHGGSACVRTRKGGGSEFIVTFERGQVTDALPVLRSEA